MIIVTQYMPYIRGGLFWFTGMAHYTIPMGTAFILLVLNSRYLSKGNKKLIPIMFILSIYIGGSHYQAILLVLILQFFFSFIDFRKVTKARICVIAAQVLLELIGLIICAKAPGNSVRAEGEFGFSIEKVVYTVFQSVVLSVKDGFEYFTSVKLIPVFAILVIAFTVMCGKRKEKHFIPAYLFVIVFAFLTYCAVYAPGVYYITYNAEMGISGGFFDTNYFCFLIFITITSVLSGEIIKMFIQDKTGEKIAISMAVLALLLMGAFSKSIIKSSADYMIYEFIKGGHLKDYAWQMEERIAILEDDTQKNVVVPEMNSEQGPFMHMALTEDPDSFTNNATKRYYGKDSVVAVPREQYYEQYGE